MFWTPSPLTLDTDELPEVFRPLNAELVAYHDFIAVSTMKMLAGIKMSHGSTTALCRAMKL